MTDVQKALNRGAILPHEKFIVVQTYKQGLLAIEGAPTEARAKRVVEILRDHEGKYKKPTGTYSYIERRNITWIDRRK